jgi:hypothetical protein
MPSEKCAFDVAFHLVVQGERNGKGHQVEGELPVQVDAGRKTGDPSDGALLVLFASR